MSVLELLSGNSPASVQDEINGSDGKLDELGLRLKLSPAIMVTTYTGILTTVSIGEG